MHSSTVRFGVLSIVLMVTGNTISQTDSEMSRNEVGLVAGATETPSIAQATGGSVNLNSSIALGVEYDRLLWGKHAALYGGLDFIASPGDVKVSHPSPEVIPEYAY
jgi:hypothetical protein